jgi:hypothetical protein
LSPQSRAVIEALPGKIKCFPTFDNNDSSPVSAAALRAKSTQTLKFVRHESIDNYRSEVVVEHWHEDC